MGLFSELSTDGREPAFGFTIDIFLFRTTRTVLFIQYLSPPPDSPPSFFPPPIRNPLYLELLPRQLSSSQVQLAFPFVMLCSSWRKLSLPSFATYAVLTTAPTPSFPLSQYLRQSINRIFHSTDNINVPGYAFLITPSQLYGSYITAATTLGRLAVLLSHCSPQPALWMLSYSSSGSPTSGSSCLALCLATTLSAPYLRRHVSPHFLESEIFSDCSSDSDCSTRLV